MGGVIQAGVFVVGGDAERNLDGIGWWVWVNSRQVTSFVATCHPNIDLVRL